MPSTYSNLKIQLMATGENNTTWGDVTNLNLGTALEEAIVGSADVTFASGDVTLTLSDTNASQTARNMRLRCTGTTGGARNLIVPAIEKPYIVQNDCADAITVKNSTGTGIAVPAGKTLWVYNNGTNVVDAVTHLSSLTLTSALPAASGGTGQNSYTTGDLLYASGATALAKLADVATGNALLSGGVGVAPAWGKIGLTTHVSGTLPVANGGTGTSTAFTTGSIVFAGASGVYSQDNANLFWDDTNNRLGIGTNAPASIGSNVTTVHARGTSGAGILFGSTSFASSASLWTSGDGSLTTLGTLTSMPLAFSTNSSERMRIDSSGNVGIGTSSPNSFAGYTYITTAGTNGSGIYFRQGATDLGLVDVYANAMHVFSQGANPLALGTNNTERMRIDSSGNVGIGTASPNAVLTVRQANNTGDGIRLFANGTDTQLITRYLASTDVWQISATYSSTGAYKPVTIMTSDLERMRITTNGNVGVGTTTPDANGKVDILGNIDPGTTPAALSVRNTGVAAGTATPQYGIRVSSQTYNNATASYGIYAFSYQNVGNATYGIWGDAGSSSFVGNSVTPFYGVVGRAYSNSAASHNLTNGTLPVGVYGTVVSTGSTNTSTTAAGYFTNASTFGSASYGIYVNVASGPTTTIAARFDFAGTEVARIDSAGGILSRGTGGIGYRTGAGGTVTQATSRTTGVTLDKTTGSITLVSAAGTTTWQSFTVTNSTVAATDVIKVVQRSGTDLYMIHVTNVAAGSFQITFATTGGTTTEQPVFNFAVIKGATS